MSLGGPTVLTELTAQVPYDALKVHFVIHSLIPPFISKKVGIFIPVEAFRYIMFVLKIFLANLLVWRNNHRICVFFMSTWKFQHVVAYATVTN